MVRRPGRAGVIGFLVALSLVGAWLGAGALTGAAPSSDVTRVATVAQVTTAPVAVAHLSDRAVAGFAQAHRVPSAAAGVDGVALAAALVLLLTVLAATPRLAPAVRRGELSDRGPPATS